MITLEKLSTNYSKLKDKIEDIILDVIVKYKNIVDWCAYRTVRKYHIVDTKLKPGYHESDTLVMHSVFSILVDFVEIQKAWMHMIWRDDLYCTLSWFERKFRQNFRSAQYGIAYLNWEITETNARQSEAAQEILDLYTWWTVIRPQRVDPAVLCGYNDVVTDDFNDSLTLAERIAKLSPILRNMNKIEDKYEKEDEKMMIRLIKVRTSLWT